MRRHPRLDANRNDIVAALRAHGASVQSLASIGGGYPDALIGLRGHNALAEFKDGSLPPSKRRLTPDEADWHRKWAGRVVILSSVEDAWTGSQRSIRAGQNSATTWGY